MNPIAIIETHIPYSHAFVDSWIPVGGISPFGTGGLGIYSPGPCGPPGPSGGNSPVGGFVSGISVGGGVGVGPGGVGVGPGGVGVGPGGVGVGPGVVYAFVIVAFVVPPAVTVYSPSPNTLTNV